MSYYVDVHTHLTHIDFAKDYEQVIQSATSKGLKAIVVNGLEPQSNRQTLALSEKYENVLAALGIYPVYAVHDLLLEKSHDNTSNLGTIERFSIEKEISFIREQGELQKISAVGECGLDGYCLDESTYSSQEQAFEALIDVAMICDLPIIVHTRKCESRAIAILESLGAKKVIFHCFTGRVKLALNASQRHGWYFSIPANVRFNQGFQKMLRELPEELILTETKKYTERFVKNG